MEKKTVEMSTTRTVYIAVDGTEFCNREDCLNYERGLERAEAEKISSKLPHFVLTPDYADDDDEWNWYLVSNEEEFDAIVTTHYDGDSTANEYEPEKYPCWLAFLTYGDGYGSVVGTEADVFAMFDRIKAAIKKSIEEAVSGEASGR